MHKNTRLLPYQRREAYRRWLEGDSVVELARKYGVSRKCLYEVFKKAKLGVFGNYSSKNHRYRSIEYGFKKLARTEAKIGKILAKRAHRLNRYVKDRPGEMVHFDTKRLPLLAGESPTIPREYLFVAVDDCSRMLFADIFPDKTQWSAAIMLDETIRAMPFAVQGAYSDNGSEYKGRKDHAFVALCKQRGIAQGFTQVKHPWTNGKAERVIKTLMTEWHRRRSFISREERRKFLYAYVRWYNQLRPHQSLNDQSPYQFLESYLARAQSVTNAC